MNIIAPLFEAAKGESIYSAAKRAVEMSVLLNINVEFTFNELLIAVTPIDVVDSVIGKYQDLHELRYRLTH